MKKSIMIKLFKTLIILLFLVMIFNNIAFASFNVKGIFTGKIDKDAQESLTSVQNVLITALMAVRTVGMAIAIIMLIVIGIKIMVASPSEKANIKQYITNYLIGAFILFSASGLLTIVKNVAMSAFTSDIQE